MSEYNGWKNKATWSVALNIGNDPAKYELFIAANTYQEFAIMLAAIGEDRTAEGYWYVSDDLDLDALNEMHREMKEGA